jgi:hypothetical protein
MARFFLHNATYSVASSQQTLRRVQRAIRYVPCDDIARRTDEHGPVVILESLFELRHCVLRLGRQGQRVDVGSRVVISRASRNSDATACGGIRVQVSS